jgi:hypothetical protein
LLLKDLESPVIEKIIFLSSDIIFVFLNYKSNY